MSFIVIEGDNGTGKDTIALKLEERLDYKIITNYEDVKAFNKYAKTFESKERVKKFLEFCKMCSNYASEGQKSIVVRYWISTLAAAYADKIFEYEEVLKLQEQYCLDFIKPDIIICLWCEFDKRVKRIEERKTENFDDTTETRNDRYAWFLQHIREQYDIRWVDINTTDKDIEQTYSEIVKVLNESLPYRKVLKHE